MAYLYIDVQVNIQLFNHLHSIYVNNIKYVILRNPPLRQSLG